MTDEPTFEHEGAIIRREIEIACDPETAYEAWADPDALARWFVDSCEGRAETGATVTWVFEAFGYRVPTPVEYAKPGERIVYRAVHPDHGSMILEISVAQKAGSTLLTVVNSGFSSDRDDGFRGVQSGWTMALATLKHQLERHPRGARSHLIEMRTPSFEWNDCWELYSTTRGLESWLATAVEDTSGAIAEGERIRIRLRDGGSLSGCILASTDRELLLEWEEIGGVIGLKAFALGPDTRAIALDVNAWSLDGDGEERLTRFVSKSLDGLEEALAQRAPSEDATA